MDYTFEKGETVLLRGKGSRFLLSIDGGMVRMKDPKGAIDTSKLIGKRPGDSIGIGSRSYVILRPDVMDHTMNLERGPQMIIPKDSSRIIFGLGLSNGSTVIEGGAGSGALTIALLNAVAPDGKVITYDLRRDHLEKAGWNIGRTSLGGAWIPKEGSIYEGIDEKGVDAFMVDVPEPERALGTASSSLRIGGRFCAYVPTFNQLERAVIAMREEGFEDIVPIEVLERGFSVKQGATRPVTEMLSHTGILVFARWYGSI